VSSNRIDLLPSFSELQDEHFYQAEKNKREQDLQVRRIVLFIFLTKRQSRKEQMEQIMKKLQDEKIEAIEGPQPTDEAKAQKEEEPAQSTQRKFNIL